MMSMTTIIAHLTRVDEAERFVKETGVDALAVSIGTLHGLYRGTPHLDFDRIAQLRVACPIPLVLHGGSDTPNPDIRRAIETGIDKINIWTDVRILFTGIEEHFGWSIRKIEYLAMIAQ
jgi:fructose/tagatose bisphosphate aldolase